MKIQVSQISEDEGLEIQEVFPEHEPALRSEDGPILGTTSIDARASRAGDELRLTGRVMATVQTDCARCLMPFPIHVDESFDLFYIPSVGRLGPDEERELAKDDLLVAFYRDDWLDLDDVVREQIELALPMARVCRDECRGLCPDCGANLNESRCSCIADEPDPRWAALEQLRSDKTGSR
jgi:uncharacterized protein